MPLSANTAYVNTIPTEQEERSPGNIEQSRHELQADVLEPNVQSAPREVDIGGIAEVAQ